MLLERVREGVEVLFPSRTRFESAVNSTPPTH
jgi:hypothetical protein